MKPGARLLVVGWAKRKEGHEQPWSSEGYKTSSEPIHLRVSSLAVAKEAQLQKNLLQ